jgi:uncharacterized delta-60 repeat protein
MLTRRTAFATAVAALFSLASHATFAADGDLYTGWGLLGSGRAIVQHDDGPSLTDTAADSVVGPDGSLYTAATVQDAQGKQRIGVSKLTPQGVLDTSFSSDGKNLSIETDVVATAIALTSDNSVLIAGYKTGNGTDTDMIVCRFFASSGANRNFPAPINDPCVKLTSFPGTQDYARDILVQPDGKFVIAGTIAVNTTTDRYAAFARFQANGLPDTGFGTLQGSNIALIRNNSTFTTHDIRSVALASNGKIVGAGTTKLVNSPDTWGLLVRLNTNGTQDALAPTQEYTFSADGSDNFDTIVRDVVLVDTADAEDDAYVAGYIDVSGGRKAGLVAKLRGSSNLNNDFGPANEGYAVSSIANANLEYVKLMRRPGDGFFVLGLRNDTDIGDFDVRSLSADGRASLSFGSNGFARVDFVLAGQIDIPVAIGFGAGGVIVSGYSYLSGTNYDVVAAKLQYDRIFASDFDL